MTQEPSPVPAARPTQRRKSTRRSDTMWFAAASLALVLFVMVSAFSAFRHSTETAALATGGDSIPTITVTVRPGDTLWKYAARYGTPGTYILDRIDAIASRNNISGNSSISPGQHLLIPVTNPVEVAKLDKDTLDKQRIASR